MLGSNPNVLYNVIHGSNPRDGLEKMLSHGFKMLFHSAMFMPFYTAEAFTLLTVSVN